MLFIIHYLNEQTIYTTLTSNFYMVDNESAAFNLAMGFLYRIQRSLIFINTYRTNFDPQLWYKEMRVLEAEIVTQLKTKDNGYEKPNLVEWDIKWEEDYRELHKNVKTSLGGYNDEANDAEAGLHESEELAEEKQKTFEPLDAMHKQLKKLIWKKGWMMPESRDIGL